MQFWITATVIARIVQKNEDNKAKVKNFKNISNTS